jgi:hypothetical protein
VWVRYCHFFNFLFVTLLIRSGLSILADHPRLYFNNECTPGSEWIKFTPITVPEGRLWTAKDDARYISLVERLWPRRISKAKRRADAWLKEVGPAPSCGSRSATIRDCCKGCSSPQRSTARLG